MILGVVMGVGEMSYTKEDLEKLRYALPGLNRGTGGAKGTTRATKVLWLLTRSEAVALLWGARRGLSPPTVFSYTSTTGFIIPP